MSLRSNVKTFLGPKSMGQSLSNFFIYGTPSLIILVYKTLSISFSDFRSKQLLISKKSLHFVMYGKPMQTIMLIVYTLSRLMEHFT